MPACPPQTTPPPQPLPSSPLHLVRSRISHTVACHPRELAILCQPCNTPQLTSWFDTSPWSFLVSLSPIALFISRDSDGSTLIGGYICRLCSCRSTNICPSVIYPVRSGIGCVISVHVSHTELGKQTKMHIPSFGMVRMGICVIDPLRPCTRPARS